MTAYTGQTSSDLPCHLCGYDLRAHPQDGRCPECGAPVAESRRVAAIPRRPAWRDSDPRWRRRMLAGTWVLVLLPLMDALQMFEWASSAPVPVISISSAALGNPSRLVICLTVRLIPLTLMRPALIGKSFR